MGDSFALSRRARDTNADIIVFCGVHFMAESAKILSPQKTVLLPAKDAGCPMADMINEQQVKDLRAQHPDAAVVCYVNTSAAVKAESDICCTSSNAVKVAKSVPNKRIVFIPDKNLGNYIAQRVPEKEFILFDGFCPTHERVTLKDAKAAKKAFPNALMLVHPECSPKIISEADFVGSTSAIIDYATKSQYKDFLIGTEQGVLHPLKKKNPCKNFYILSPKMICPNMKKTTLNDLLNSLENMTHEITLSEEEIDRAYKSLDKMLNIQ